MILTLASILAIAAIDPPPPPAARAPQGSGSAIVVTGQRIRDLEASLRACHARNCAPDEDIDASLALAESQIIDGRYKQARRTLLAALGRNHDEAKRYPIPVSDLYRANGRVAAHLGYDSDYYRSTWGIYRTLKDGLPADTVRHYSSLMEVAEMMGRTRGHERARLYYTSIAERARRERRPDIAAIAELRSAIRHLPPGSSWQMNEIRRIAALEGDELRAPVLEARLALARMAYEHGDEQRANAIVGEIAALGLKRPILVYAPSYEMIERELGGGESLPEKVGQFDAGSKRAAQGTPMGSLSVSKRLPGNFDDMWIDVEFRITPEGKVSELEIVRKRGDLFWTGPLLASIRKRRYTPGRPGDQSSVRLERYTYTSGFQVATGTHFVERSPKARVEYFDLTSNGLTAPD